MPNAARNACQTNALRAAWTSAGMGSSWDHRPIYLKRPPQKISSRLQNFKRYDIVEVEGTAKGTAVFGGRSREVGGQSNNSKVGRVGSNLPGVGPIRSGMARLDSSKLETERPPWLVFQSRRAPAKAPEVQRSSDRDFGPLPATVGNYTLFVTMFGERKACHLILIHIASRHDL